MAKAKLALSRLHIVGLTGWAFAIFLVLITQRQTKADVANLGVSLSCFKEQIVLADPNQERPVLVPVNETTSFDPVVLKLTISNLSKQDIPVLSPEFPPRTLLPFFQRKTDGKLVPPQVKWSASLIHDYINIPPGKTYEVLLYLEELFPLGIPPGAYDVRLKYTPDYKTWIQTNSILLEITPISNEDKKQFEEVLAILQGGIEWKAKRANRFFARVPNSRFTNMIRLEVAPSQMALRNFESAHNTLNLVIADQNATTFQKNQAYWRKGHLLKKTGKLEEAIKCMEKAQFRVAYRQAVKWKKEEN